MFVFKRRKTGFSLIELSVVILIISILASGAISVSGVFLVNAKNKQTKDRMDAIYKSIGAYVAKNHHLPCPSSFENSKTDSGYGVEEGTSATINTARTCDEDTIFNSSDLSNINYGMVPVSTLGLSDEMAEDGFGSRFSYIVVEQLAGPNYNDTTPGVFSEGFSYYSETSAEMIQIIQTQSGNVIQNVAFAIISHGQNKLGAFNANSTTQNSVTGISAQEGQNVISNIVSGDADFGQHPSHVGLVTFTASDSDDGFDDIILYKSRDEIIDDFSLGHLYFCDDSDTNYSGDNYSGIFNFGYSGQVVYGDGATACDNDATIFPSKECGPRGSAWIEKVTCPPVP